MNILIQFLRASTLNAIFSMIKSQYHFWEQKNNIGRRLYNEGFKNLLAQYLCVEKIKTDYIGRLYCVVNPALNSKGQFDTNMIIYEMDNQGIQFSTDKYVEQWLVKKLQIIQDLFKQRDLFSQLEFKVSHVGPTNHDNFLIIIQPKTFDDMQYDTRRCFKRLGVWATILFIVLGCLKFIY